MQVQNHPWFSDISWQRLFASEIASPLQVAAQEQLNKLSFGTEGGELPDTPLDEATSISWLSEVDRLTTPP